MLCSTELKYTKKFRQTAKFPDNSLTFQSKQNSLTFRDFPESGNPGTFSEAFYKHYPIPETKW